MIAGKYRVLRLLGRGGEGDVYLVRHLLTDDLRAVKISEGYSEIQSLHELQMMKQISHPSLPHVIDVEESVQGICLVMEYISGKTLSEYVQEGDVTELFFYRTAEQLLDVLEYLHTCHFPMLHLDVKPSNIIIREDGSLVLLDLGAAMPLQKKVRKKCYGTKGFAAPEQFDPFAELTACTDLYGFGASMYYLLYGRKYEGRDRKWQGHRWTAHAGEKTEKQDRFGNPSVRWKRRAEALILPCLEKDPKRRPGSAMETKRNFQRFKKKEERKRAGLQILLALVLLSGTLLFACQGFISSSQDKEKQYADLLEESKYLGNEQAFSCYKKAVILCPEKAAVFQEYVQRIISDLKFSLEEEKKLQELLKYRYSAGYRNIENIPEESREGYGAFAYQAGIAYWYFYEGSGGRAAAASWFQKAVNCIPQKEIDINSETKSETDAGVYWKKEAVIYEKISSYYEKLGSRNIAGMENASPVQYWWDLEELSELVFAQEINGNVSQAVQESIMEERLNLLILETVELKKGGIEQERLQESIRQMKLQGASQSFPERCKEAEDAVRRVYEEQP